MLSKYYFFITIVFLSVKTMAQISYTSSSLDYQIKHKKDAVFKIYTHHKDNVDIIRTGTGFLISKDGYFVTAYHVVREFIDGDDRIITIDGSKNVATPIDSIDIISCSDNRNIDLCLLKINTKLKVPYFPPHEIKVNKGTKVATIAHCQKDWNVKTGIFVREHENMINYYNTTVNYNWTIISKYNNKGDVRSVEIDGLKVCPGDSGGPVFGSNGELIGMNMEFIKVSTDGENVTNVLDSMLSYNEVFDYFKKNKDKEAKQVPKSRIMTMEEYAKRVCKAKNIKKGECREWLEHYDKIQNKKREEFIKKHPKKYKKAMRDTYLEMLKMRKKMQKERDAFLKEMNESDE